MVERLFVTVTALALMPGPCIAAIMLPFDAQHNTWNATHIVVVEGGKVAESWLGDLKPGDTLPEGAVRYTRIPVPDTWAGFSGEKPPAVSSKRMVLFLAFAPREGKDPKTPVWTGADMPGHPHDGAMATAVAWVEGDAVYSVIQPINPGGYKLYRSDGIAGLKQRVDVGLAIRAQFEAATADPDHARRAERIVALAPIVSHYARYCGRSDCVREVSRCGPAGVPHLVRWTTEPTGEFVDLSLFALCGLGDVGFDAVVKLLDDEVRHWRQVADGLKPGESVRESPGDGRFWVRSPHHLYRVLLATRGMKLSGGNRKRLQEHPGLRELDQLLSSRPGMKPEKSSMVEAHEVLRDILAGKFRGGE